MKKFKLLFIIPILGLTLAFSTGSFVSAVSSVGQACSGLTQLSKTGGCGGNSTASVNKIAKTAINILSLIIGVASVVVIIISGFRFITSTGDANTTSSARTQLIYAIIGLIVVAIAQLIARLALNTGNVVNSGDIWSLFSLKIY